MRISSILRALPLLSLPLLAACAQPILNDISDQEIAAMNCKQLSKQNDYLLLKLVQLRENRLPFKTDDDVDEARQEAQRRLKKVEESSVQKFCTFG
ncbi:hypothetical protein [Brackiella oedipodis]|uniref:hypothetical protein n=1 Tax=Brackiella oedipodis TaxID=124225 RepID=UPI00048FED8D|nr:hypothetical protein [Brackiella oedipodis]